MSLTKPIPKEMREELAEDLFMKSCCVADSWCSGRIEWHHALIYASKRVNEKWAILPLCQQHHKSEASNRVAINKVMVQRATYEELAKYSKAIDYCAIKKRYE